MEPSVRRQVAEHWLSGSSSSTGDQRKPASPGVILMQREVQATLQTRQTSAMASAGDKLATRHCGDALKLVAGKHYDTSSLPKSSDKSDVARAARAEGLSDIAAQENQRHVETRRLRKLQQVRAEQEKAKVEKRPYTGPSPKGVNRAARAWSRAYADRWKVVAAMSKKRIQLHESAKTNPKFREDWRKFRRDEEEWKPPSMPSYAKSKRSKGVNKRRRQIRRDRKTLPKLAITAGDTPGADAAADRYGPRSAPPPAKDDQTCHKKCWQCGHRGCILPAMGLEWHNLHHCEQYPMCTLERPPRPPPEPVDKDSSTLGEYSPRSSSHCSSTHTTTAAAPRSPLVRSRSPRAPLAMPTSWQQRARREAPEEVSKKRKIPPWRQAPS